MRAAALGSEGISCEDARFCSSQEQKSGVTWVMAPGLSVLQVELLVMKALSVGLVKGSIDEVDKRVHMTWVQPRVLDLQQVMATSSSGAGGRRPGSDPGAGKGPGLGMSPLGAWLCPGVFRRDRGWRVPCESHTNTTEHRSRGCDFQKDPGLIPKCVKQPLGVSGV